MYKKFPQLLGGYITSRVNNMIKDKREHLNNLLQENFNISIQQLIKLFIDNLNINTRDKDYYIMVDDVMVNNVKLEAIIRTVDYGNSKFPPYNLFNTSLMFVNNNLEALYKYSYLGVN